MLSVYGYSFGGNFESTLLDIYLSTNYEHPNLNKIKMETNLASFTDILSDGIPDSQPLSLCSNNTSSQEYTAEPISRPKKHTGQHGEFRSVEEIDLKYREVFTYPYFNLVQSRVMEDALYSDKSMVVCAPTGSGKTVVFEMAIVQLLMEIDEKKYDKDFKIIYMAPVKALCTERLTEWYSKFTKLGLLCIEVTGDTDVDVSHLKPYRVIITTPEKWDILTRRWRDHRGLVELIKLFLIDEVHILNDEIRGPVLEAVVSRMKTIESSTQSEYRIEQLQRQYQSGQETKHMVLENPSPPRIRFVAVSATVSNPEDVATWLGNNAKPAVYYKFGDECRPVRLKRVVEGYPCSDGTSIFKFDIILNYKLWPIIQKYHDGKPTLIFCNTRKSVMLTAETLSREITISFNPEQRARLTALASTIKNKKLQSLVLAGVGCHHAGLLFEERVNIENAFRNRDLPILITTTTLAMGVNLPAHLVIIKNTQQYVNGAYQEYSISTVLQMVGRAGRPQFDTEATAVIMTRMSDKPRYEALVCGSEPLQSFLHKRLPENLNSEAALGTVKDVAQCVQWLRSTFLYVRAAQDPKRYLGLPNNAPQHLISKKIEELCVRAMNGLATAGLISMDEASCIESTDAGRLMSIFYLDLETMKHIMKIEGTATLEQVLWVVCESHELADMHLRVDERRCLNGLNRNNAAPTIRFPMKGKINTRQMKLNCVIQAVLGCLPIPDASLNQEAMKIMRTADRICKCLVEYVTRSDLISGQPKFYNAVLNSIILAKCITAHIWENSPYVSKQLKGIGPTFSTLLATAGKTTFMLLEESHPRDLERIMNKGPPAGNALRKQVSLLPKYQITMTPVDEKVVTMQLSLLNHNYLAENIENLTAGERHKSYIIVGDSENHLLLLKSFQDKDLIGMYDGHITHEIKRKHNFEHKIIMHCVSSMFVGIDAKCEYIFKDLDPAPMLVNLNRFYCNNSPATKNEQKQTFITDIYKAKKRTKTFDCEISQSREKKRRESALADKIKLLKESFGRASKETKEELQKTTEMSNKIVHEILNNNEEVYLDNTKKLQQQSIICENNVNEDVETADTEMIEYVDDTKINDILMDIESEILKEVDNFKDSDNPCDKRNMNKFIKNRFQYLKGNKLNKKPKSNFNCLELLNKNVDLHEAEDNNCMNDTGFSNTIKSQIDKYLQKTKLSSTTPDILMDTLIQDKSNAGIEKTENNTETVIHWPVVYKSIEKNETKTKPLQIESEVVFNNIESETEDTNIDIETKLDASITKSVTPLDTDAPLFQNHKTNVKEITNEIHHSDTILNDMENIDSHRIQKEFSCKKFPMDKNTVNNNDNRDASLGPLEMAQNYLHQFDIDNTIVTNNVHSNFDEIDKEKETKKDNSKTDKWSTSKTLNDGFLVGQIKDGTNDLNTNRNYIRNFSYSAMNFDIATHQSANHNVHVIKKIKVDLDVTEIVTHDHINKNRNSVLTSNENASKLIPLTKTLGCSYFGSQFESISETHKEQVNVPVDKTVSIYQNYESVDSQIIPEIQVSKPMGFSNVLQKGNFVPKNQINCINFWQTDKNLPKKVPEANDVKSQVVTRITHKKLLEADNTENSEIPDSEIREIIFSERKLPLSSVDIVFNAPSTEVKTGVAVIKEEDMKCAETEHIAPQKLVDFNNKIIPAKISNSENNTVANTSVNYIKHENNLEDILQKYRQVFKQSKKMDIKFKDKLPQVVNASHINKQKNKRLFKITDIDRIDPKLPSLLTAETPVFTRPPQNKEVIAEKHAIPQISDTVTTNETIEVTEIKRNLELFSEEEDKVEPLIHPLSRHDTTNDYKIDDSMLDPKTLLQCLIKEEPEIIPPPPEFSDLNYSPSQYQSFVNNVSYEGPDCPYQDFEENSLRNCSSEIETILLSNNDNEYTETVPWIINSSSTLRNVPDENYNTARRTKLNTFKLINKKKLKIMH